MAENVRYEEVLAGDEEPTGYWTFAVVGDNGEVQARSERYTSKHNARRGAADLARTLMQAVTQGELDMSVE